MRHQRRCSGPTELKAVTSATTALKFLFLAFSLFAYDYFLKIYVRCLLFCFIKCQSTSTVVSKNKEKVLI